MSTNFFANFTIASAEDIRTACERFASIVFANEAERTGATAEMLALIDGYNATLKSEAVFAIVNNSDIFSALIPAAPADVANAKTDAQRKRAIVNAVSYTQYKVTAEGGKNAIRPITKALTIRDIYNALCVLNASRNADRKVTKSDREKAFSVIFGGGKDKALRCFMIGAYRFENVADDIVKAFSVTDAEMFTDAKPSKTLAEKQLKATASAFGFERIAYKKIHALTLYKRAYTVDRFHQSRTADLIDFAQDFIIASRYAAYDIALPDTLDKAGIFATVEAESDDSVIIF